LTPREGARIQSFPDWFQFYGNISEVKSQVGNAVPPLLAIALCEQTEKALAGDQ
jgi:DNA (cytosine-5)-methyltransferase 1